MSGVKVRRLALAATLTVAVAGAAVLVLRRSEALPDGPQDVIWDHTACAECSMSVTERGYAAQLQTTDGRVLDFDDPGCLFRWERHEAAPVHAIWFHHLREERWLAEGKAGFVAAGPSPMGYDLGAVDAGADGAISVAAARERFAAPGEGKDDHAH